MTRGILIAGNESTLSRAIAAEAGKRVEHYAAALIPSRLSGAGNSEPPRAQAQAGLSLQWNPSSPISARTLVLAAENRMEHINEAILVCAPPSIRRPAAELSLSEIEILVNDHVKGWFFLVKELSAVFRARKAGTLALVYSEIGSGGGKDDPADILGPSALASFQAFTRSLLAAAYGEPYLSMGFSCSEAGTETGFAAYVMKFLDEGNRRNNGKLHKYGKFSFLK
jgi:NAD(P)-dependent dehydrogenase (short-subunit alcohol dehydrogenase family)